VLSHFKPDGDPTPLPPAVVALPAEELPFLRPGLHHTVTTRARSPELRGLGLSPDPPSRVCDHDDVVILSLVV